MVKGLSRRVVMVRFPEAGVFEQAIFVVRDDAAARKGVSAERVIQEACDAAQGFIRPSVKRGRHWPPLVYALSGAAGVGAAWLVSALMR